ncbi:putative transcriptional regulator [Clostridium sp. ASBs410]|nr:putative transcriptional regulator [Clostridium sp. ASBs410]
MIKRKLNPEQGKRLNECLKDIRMAQKELAQKSGYTQQYISNIVVGKKNMSHESAEIFANILCVRKDYLLCQDDFKTDNAKRRCSFDYYDEYDKFVSSILNHFGISVIKSIVRTKEGKSFVMTDNPRVIGYEDILVGKKIKISGEVQTPISINVCIEVGGIQKEIPINDLHRLIKDIMGYINFKCEDFQKEFFHH